MTDGDSNFDEIPMSASACRLMTIAVAAALGGCAATPLRREEGIRFVRGPARAANVAYTRSDGWHVWADPDESPFGPMQISALQRVVPAKTKLLRAREGGQGVPGPVPLVAHHRAGNILFAPGWNPVLLSDWTDEIWDVLSGEDKRFGARYKYAAALQKKRRVDAHYSERERSWTIRFHRVPGSPEESRAGLQVDHSFLIYLLQAHAFWDQLRN